MELSEGLSRGSFVKVAPLRHATFMNTPLQTVATNALWLGVGLAFITPPPATRRARGLGQRPKMLPFHERMDHVRRRAARTTGTRVGAEP
jgi:hypothetical protein